MPRKPRGPGRLIPCEVCSSPFLPRPCAVLAGQGRFCSRKCKVAHQRKVWRGMTPAERFWSLVQKGDGCWLWTGALTRPGGHGRFANTTAHRFCWLLLRGPIPAGENVCHDCPGGDNPLCVNPDHMFLGTQVANMQDYYAKRRAA